MKREICLLLLACMCSVFAWSQTRQVTGRVVSDSTGLALSGVNVTVKGTGLISSTNSEGRFSIAVPETGNVVLVFSSIGFTPQEIGLGTRSSVNVTLATADGTMDVVVIGYQTVRRRDLTGSVSSVSAKQLKDVPLNSAAEALAGRLAGVQVTGTEGTPNAEVMIKVRGGGSITQDNSPLYIIDGIQVENALSVISPQDIETIDVLKDASATAIYGARGANGVVIITTKGGKAQKPVISYNGFFGVDQLANKLEVMQPYDFVRYQYERSRGNTTEMNNFMDTYGRFEDLDLYKSVPFVDWQDEMFGRNALRQSHNVSLTGGSGGTTYNLSATYNLQEGIQRGSDFDRKLVSFKFEHGFSKLLKVGFNTRFNKTEVNGAGTSNPGSSSTNRLRHSIKYRPFLVDGQGLQDYDQNYANETNANSLALVNPILLNDAEYRKSFQSLTNISGFAELKFTDFLSFRSTAGYDTYSTEQRNFDDTITNLSKSTGLGKPLAAIGTTNRQTINNSNVFTYTNARMSGDFARKNKLTILLGHEIYQVKNSGANMLAKEFPLGIQPEKALGNMNLGTPYIDNSNRPTYQNEFRLVSLFGRLQYDFDQRFLAQLTYRADGSSKFGEGHKWGYFPSGSVAWRISNENFFEGVKNTINDLKLRVSYGEAGNNRIDDFKYLTQFNSATQYWLNDLLNSGYQPDGLANANLIWETTISRNIGLDFGFWKNRLTLSVDAYKNTTNDLLIDVPVPTSSGYTTQLQNVGSTVSKGLEVQLGASIISKKDFTWDANFNASFGRVKIESIGAYQDFYFRNSGWGFSNSPADYIVREGDYIGSMWGFQTAGMYTLDDFNYVNGAYVLKPGVASNQGYTSLPPAPGRLKFTDINGDSVINEKDKGIIGVAQPKVFGGLQQSFRYKNFDLSIFLNYQFGNEVYNANKLEFTSGYQGNANLLSIMNDRWTNVNAQGQVVTDPVELAKLNANATLWTPPTSSTSFLLHSWAVEDGSFIRINNVSLGYNFSKDLLRKARIASARLYFTVSNLAVFTNYSGYDPEVSTRRRTPETPGVDYSAYPRSRAYLVGLNLSF